MSGNLKAKRRKRSRLSTTLLSMILSIGITNVARAEGLEHDVVLDRGGVAPFRGVLVPEMNYRDFTLSSEMYPYCGEQLRDMEKKINEENDSRTGLREVLLILVSGVVGYSLAR